ncbi:MAG: glycosyltransferase family 4 protein [Promethearchaeota archaeon]
MYQKKKRKLRKITILRLSTRIYPDPSGPSKHAYFLSKYIAQNNKHYKIINLSSCPKNTKKRIDIISDNHIIYHLPIQVPRLGTKHDNLKKLIFLLEYIFLSIYFLMKIHKKERIHLIQADTPAITSIPAIIMRLIFKIPYIYFFHGLPYRGKKTLEKMILSFIVSSGLITKTASKVLVISEIVKKYFITYLHREPKKYYLIENGIEVANEVDLNVSSEKKKLIIKSIGLKNVNNLDNIITYIGFMDIEPKVLGMKLFLEAFDEFLSEMDQIDKNKFKLIFIGDGIHKNILEEVYNRIKHKEHVIFTGERNDVKKFLQIADLNVLTTSIEGAPTVLLEAMNYGIPCLATDVGEIRKMLKGTGFLVKKNNKEEIKLALKRFFKLDQNTKILLKNQCSEVVRRYNDWNIIQKEVFELYRNTIFKN